MRILLTGSSGCVGRAIAQRLSPLHGVVGLDRLPASTTQLVGDIEDVALLRQGIAGADAVIHSAALHAPHVGQFSDSEFERINIKATQLLINIAREAGVRRFIYTSTTALFGYANQSETGAAWITEDTLPKPRTIYHHTKLAAEALLALAADQGALDVRILRMSRCFPEPAPVMAAYRLHRGVDARDVADAHMLALTNDGPSCQRYIISGRTPFSPQDCSHLLRDPRIVLTSRLPEFVKAMNDLGWPQPTSIDRVYDSGLAQHALGWDARFGFDEVIAQWRGGSPEVLSPNFKAGDGND